MRRFSMDPVRAAFGLDIDFHKDCSTNAVFTTAVQGENAAQTFFRRRSAAGADTLAFSDGAGLSYPTILWVMTTKKKDWGITLQKYES